MVEAFVEEEFLEVVERGEEERVEGGVVGARWVRGFVGNVAEAEFNNVCFLWLLSGRSRRVVANDAMWGGETEVVREESAPGNGGVEGMQHLVNRFLFGGVKERLLLREGEAEAEEERPHNNNNMRMC